MKVISLAMFLMVALMSVALAACGDDPKNEPSEPTGNENGNGNDDDDDSHGMPSASIVGLWEFRDEIGEGRIISWIWTFNANGTYETTMQEETSSTILSEAEGTYSCQGNMLTMIVTDEDGQQQVETYEYNIIDNSLVITDAEGSTYFFTRIDEVQKPTNSIVGTWKWEKKNSTIDTYEIYKFNADGTFSYYMYEDINGSIGEDESGGTYSFKNNELVLNWNDYETEVLSCSLDGDKLTIDSQEFFRIDESGIPDDPVTTNPLIGSWEYYDESGYYEALTFDADGSFMMYTRYSSSFGDTGYGTYIYTSNRILLKWEGDEETEEIAYSVVGRTLKIWDPSDPEDVQVYTYTNYPLRP